MTDEQKTNEAEASTVSESDPSEGNDNPTGSLLDRADASSKRLQEQLEKYEKLIQKEEELAARRALGGKSDGSVPEEKKEETAADYAKDVLSGKYNVRD